MNPDVFQCLFAEIAALPKKSPLLQKTIVAISCVYLGKVQGDESMLRHGAQLYNNGLGIMSRMLSRQLYTDELLYTAMIFQELEVRLSTRIDDIADIPGYTLSPQSWRICDACYGNQFYIETVLTTSTGKSSDSCHLPQTPQIESSR